MKNAVKAIIRKDLREVSANRQLFAAMLLVPLVMAVVLPSAFVLLIHFVPEEMADFERLTAKIPGLAGGIGSPRQALGLAMNYLVPVFFLIIPIMASSVMAASAFVGEKEKQTLETLLVSPLSLREIFRAKVLAAFGLGMLASAVSFVLMLLVTGLLTYFLEGEAVWPGINWLVVLLVAAPALSMIAVTLIVRVSARAKSVMESQQAGAFLVLPLAMLAAGQFTGLLALSPWLLLALGLAAAGLAWLMLNRAMRRFTYERLLR